MENLMDKIFENADRLRDMIKADIENAGGFLLTSEPYVEKLWSLVWNTMADTCLQRRIVALAVERDALVMYVDHASDAADYKNLADILDSPDVWSYTLSNTEEILYVQTLLSIAAGYKGYLK